MAVVDTEATGEGLLASTKWSDSETGKETLWYIACDTPGCKSYGGMFRIDGEAIAEGYGARRFIAQGWRDVSTGNTSEFLWRCPECCKRGGTSTRIVFGIDTVGTALDKWRGEHQPPTAQAGHGGRGEGEGS